MPNSSNRRPRPLWPRVPRPWWAATEAVADPYRFDAGPMAELKPWRMVPLTVERDLVKSYVTLIDPGPVPPTFVHSWALDVEGVHQFWLSCPANGLTLNFASGDTITVYVPQTNQRFEFQDEAMVRSTPIELKQVAGSTAKKPVLPRRIYVILRTSTARYAAAGTTALRRFRLEGLRVEQEEAAENATARLLDDSLNTQLSPGANDPGWFVDGGDDVWWAPWTGNSNTMTGALLPAPDPREGWQLLARFTDTSTTREDTPIWALMYYNEQTSRVRVYVLPRVPVGTGIEVVLRLFARHPITGYAQLEGALFDQDARPSQWHEAKMVIPLYERDHWAMVETRMLFPMAKLPEGVFATDRSLRNAHDEGANPGIPTQKDWYVPVYDSTFEAGLGNHRLVLKLTPFLRSEADLDFLGRGVGEAVEKTGLPSTWTVFKDVASSGKSAFDLAREIYNAAKADFEQKNPKGTPLPSILAAGASYFAGPAAVFGAMAGLLTTMLNPAEPMKLALDFLIRGGIDGQIYTKLAGVTYAVYLPGRFDAEEMHQFEKVSLKAQSADQLIPRYDRTLGHLGLRYDPSFLHCPFLYFAHFGDYETGAGWGKGVLVKSPEWRWYWSTRCVWPGDVPHPFGAYLSEADWTVDADPHPAPVALFLPVLYNEFAEIEPAYLVDATPVQIAPVEPQPHQPTRRWVANLAWVHHVVPESDDASFPSLDQPQPNSEFGGWSIWVYHDQQRGAFDRPAELSFGMDANIPAGLGYWLDAGPGRRLQPLRDFEHVREVKTQGYGQLLVPMWDPDVNDPAHPEDTGPNYRRYVSGDPWPLSDVIFRWDLVYFYYGRSRQRDDGSVPRRLVTGEGVRAPVTLRVDQWEVDWGTALGHGSLQFGNTADDPAPSGLLAAN